MKAIRAVCVGAGNRGIIYCDYAKDHPNELKIVGVVDPNKLHRDELAKSHGINEDMRFATVEEFIEAKVEKRRKNSNYQKRIPLKTKKA